MDKKRTPDPDLAELEAEALEEAADAMRVCAAELFVVSGGLSVVGEELSSLATQLSLAARVRSPGSVVLRVVPEGGVEEAG